MSYKAALSNVFRLKCVVEKWLIDEKAQKEHATAYGSELDPDRVHRPTAGHLRKLFLSMFEVLELI